MKQFLVKIFFWCIILCTVDCSRQWWLTHNVCLIIWFQMNCLELLVRLLCLLAVICKSQIKSHSGMTNHLTKRFKSLCQITNQMNEWNQIQITWTQIAYQIKSRCQPNEKSFRLYSLCAKCHQCTSGLTVNVSAKIRDGNILPKLTV